MKVGFVGLGNLGLPMAHRLLDAGHDLTVWARHSVSLESFDGTRASIATTPGDVGRACGCRGRLRRGWRQPGGIVLVHSTIALSQVVELAQQLTPLGLHVVDAPVSGGPGAARRGDLTMMLGGSDADLDRVAPAAVVCR